MEFTSVYHKTSEQMSYPRNQRELVINLKTGYDVKQVWIHYGDPFEAGILGGNETWTGKRREICSFKRLEHQLWWTIILKPPYKRCKYYFELHTEKETWYYFEDGFLTEEQLHKDGRMLQYFVVPWMNPADLNVTPDWVKETVWYQIFPDRFCNGTPEKNTPEILPWRTGSVTSRDRFGGNLAGIRKRLDYLCGLGISGIYLNPVFKAESNHKYDTEDYEKIDPAFGDEKEFALLVKEAHARGIRIMVDAVFNHCGRKFAPWLDVQKKGKSSPYADWFMVNDWTALCKNADTRDGRFYSFAFAEGMPKLNTGNPQVQEYFCSLCERWIRDYDIDGIRFDVGNEISHSFLKKLRIRLKAIKPEVYLLGEIWHNASQWLMGDEYDSVMNYPLMSGICDFFLDRTKTGEDFEYMINRCCTMYMQQCSKAMFNLLDSHDTERLMNRVRDLDLFYQQLAVLFTMPGSPCIYYGTEIAMEGGFDPDCRRCMPWEELETETNRQRIREMIKLISLRNQEPAFRSLQYDFPGNHPEQRLIEYEKQDAQGGRIQVILNCSEKPVRLKGEGEILFQRGFRQGILEKNGTLIRRR